MCSRLLVAVGCWLLVVVVVLVVVMMMVVVFVFVIVVFIFLVSKCGKALNENHKLHCS